LVLPSGKHCLDPEVLSRDLDRALDHPNHVPTFFWEFLANPISLVLSVAVILLLLNQTPLWPRRRKAAGQEA
jgi:hypothetical protein